MMMVYTEPPVCVCLCCVVSEVGAGKGVSLSLAERTLVGNETMGENLEGAKEWNNHNNLAASRELNDPEAMLKRGTHDGRPQPNERRVE